MPRINIAITSQGLPHERCGACGEVIVRGLPMYEVVEQRNDSLGWICSGCRSNWQQTGEQSRVVQALMSDKKRLDPQRARPAL